MLIGLLKRNIILEIYRRLRENTFIKGAILRRRGKLPIAKLVFACLMCFISSGLSGCAKSGIALIVDSIAASKLSGERANINVTEDENIIDKCQFIKHVRAYNGFGGRLQDKAIEKAIVDLTHDSAQAGANTLLVLNKKSGFSGTRVEGDAYLCPDVKDIPIP